MLSEAHTRSKLTRLLHIPGLSSEQLTSDSPRVAEQSCSGAYPYPSADNVLPFGEELIIYLAWCVFTNDEPYHQLISYAMQPADSQYVRPQCCAQWCKWLARDAWRRMLATPCFGTAERHTVTGT